LNPQSEIKEEGKKEEKAPKREEKERKGEPRRRLCSTLSTENISATVTISDGREEGKRGKDKTRKESYKGGSCRSPTDAVIGRVSPLFFRSASREGERKERKGERLLGRARAKKKGNRDFPAYRRSIKVTSLSARKGERREGEEKKNAKGVKIIREKEEGIPLGKQDLLSLPLSNPRKKEGKKGEKELEGETGRGSGEKERREARCDVSHGFLREKLGSFLSSFSSDGNRGKRREKRGTFRVN